MKTITPPTPELIQDLGMLYPNKESKVKKRYGLYRCNCDKEFEAIVSNIKSGITKSCGCYHIRMATDKNIIHGLSKSPLFNTWVKIKQRCNNINNKDYLNYGARGIKICDKWENNFLLFYNWSMKNGYSQDLSIDRIDNNGNYEPSNCRWVDKYTQARNTRKIMSTNTSGYRGVHFDKSCNKWIASITVENKQIKLGRFDTRHTAAEQYDLHVLNHKLEHTVNGVLQ